jgi:hypothetical protein
VLALLVLAGLARPAWARSEKTLAYQRAEVWPAAVRFLVVDERLKVTEKDAEAGYVLFELRDDGKLFRGSLEVMTVVRDGRSLVRFVLQIVDRPSWLEIAMLARLETKLRMELGSPSPPPSKQDPPPKDEPKPDAPRPDAPKLDAAKPEAATTGAHALDTTIGGRGAAWSPSPDSVLAGSPPR